MNSESDWIKLPLIVFLFVSTVMAQPRIPIKDMERPGDPLEPRPRDPVESLPGDPLEPLAGDPLEPPAGDPLEPLLGDPPEPLPGDPLEPLLGDPVEPRPRDLLGPPPGDLLGPLCELDAEIPDDLIQCGSCVNRCGNKTALNFLNYPKTGDTCSCDQFCGYHGDCCQDFEEFCPEEYDLFKEQSGLYPLHHNRSDFKCMSLYDGSLEGKYNLMIHTCPDGTECEFTSQLNEDVNTFVPMYDVHRGVHYISGQCAICNGVTSVLPWGVNLECKSLKDPKEYISTGLVNSTESLTDIKDVGDCRMLYSVVGESRPCVKNVFSTCKDSCLNEELVALCESAAQDLMLYKKGEFIWSAIHGVYRNPYCALCNAHANSTTSGLVCSKNLDYIEHDIPEVMYDFSLTLVFDFDPRKGLTVGNHPPPECAVGEIYVPDEDACRPIKCISGFVLDVSECIPESTSIIAIVTGTFSVEPTQQIIETLYQGKDDLQKSVEDGLGETLESFGIIRKGFVVDTKMSYENKEFKALNKLMCHCDYTSLFATDENNRTHKIDEFEEAVANKVRKNVIKYLLQRNLHLKTVKAFVQSELQNSSTLNSQHVDCTWLVYQLNEIQMENGTGSVTVVPSGKTYASGMFQTLDEVVIVCEKELNDSVKETEMVNYTLNILTLVCIGISIMCLLARIILQHFITSFKKRPGKIQLQLTFTLLFAFVMLVLGPFLSGIPEACTTAAILLAYGFLAAFIWMNVIAVDTWLVFKPSAAFSRADEQEKSLLVHIICGWGIPILLVAVSIAINYSDVDERFVPKFGGSRCWYTQRYAMLLYFGVPIALSIILNIFLYISTSYNLHKAFQNSLVSSNMEGYHFGIYVRLFILMGITWIFGFISAFTDEIIIDFIFVILTSLQGLFLSISFVCNKRVLSEMKETVRRETALTLSNGKTSFDSNSKNESVL